MKILALLAEVEMLVTCVARSVHRM